MWLLLKKIEIALVLTIVLVPSTGLAWAKQADLALSFSSTNVEVQTGADGKAVFVCKDVQWLNRTGEPQIPWQVMSVLLPPDVVFETVDVQLKEAQFKDVEGRWDVAPAPPLATAPRVERQKEVFWPKDKTIVDGRDVDIYQKDAVWPDTDVRLVATGRLRKWRLAQVALPLVKYNPVQRTLQRLVSGKLEVYFDHLSLAMTDTAIRAEMLDTIGEGAVKRIAVNFEQQRGAYTEAMRIGKALVEETGEAAILSGEGASPGYVIITTSEIQSASQELNNFVAHKQSKGFDVQVITDANFGGGVGDTAAENIRTWLQGHYVSDNIKYVLLIGNPHPYQGDVPMKMLYPRNNEGDEYKESPSDYYYADLTGNWDLDGDGYYGEWDHDFGTGGVDRNWEVLVGRIQCYPYLEPNTIDAQVLYDSGEPQMGIYNGENNFLGFISGNWKAGYEQRWSAHPFTIPEGTWNIARIDVDYFIGADFDLVNYIIWERTGQEKPEAGDELIQGTVSAPVGYDDPRVPQTDVYLHHIDVNFPLDAGDYYLTIYAERLDGLSCDLAWLGNTENGIPLLGPNTNPNPGVNAFFWRSAQFPNPGFQEYNLPTSTWASLTGQDPNQLYTATFTIYGNPADTNGTASAQIQQPLADSVDVNDLDHILGKIIAYENTPQSESAWRQRILLPMKSDGYANEFVYQLGEEIKETIIVPKTGWTYYRIYDEDYSLSPPPELIPCAKDNVTNAWNGSPFGVVGWATHGSTISASYVMDLDHAATLNDNYPAFTFQASCLTAHPETPVNLAYSLLKNGAICTVGATRIAWIYVWQTSFAGTDTANGMAVEYLTRLIGEELDSGHSLHELKQTIVPASASMWMNYPDFCIYGCPAVGLYSYEPNAMTVSPHHGLSCEGDAGGPFDPNFQIYTITNESNEILDYQVSKTQDWLSLNGSDGPITGSLDPNESVEIITSLNSNAEYLPAGSYSDSVEFLNLTTGIGNINRRVRFKPSIIYAGATIVPYADALAVDHPGNLFVAGYGGRFIKIEPDGTQGWDYTYDVGVHLRAVACDSSGNIFVGGNFSGTVDLDPTTGEDWFSSGPGFITRFNHDGTYAWSQSITGATYGIVCDPFGRIIVVAGGGIIARLSPSGSFDWTYDSATSFNGVACDSFGNVILTGTFSGTLDFDPTGGVDSRTSNGNYDAFVTKLNEDGSYDFTHTFGGSGYERGVDVAVNHNGDIFVTGDFDDMYQSVPYTVDFDPTGGTDFHFCHGGSDTYITKLGPDGSYLWTRTIASNYNEGGMFGGQGESPDAIALDGAGNILIVGGFGCCIPVDFDPTYETDWYTCRGRYDIFVTRLTSDGGYHWTGVMGGPGVNSDYGKDVVVDYKGNVYVAGSFYESADLDPTEGEDWHSAGSGQDKEFIVKIRRGAVPVIIADTDHDGDVDFTDLGTFSSNWLEADCANLNWCDWSDFNRSTKVDFIDFAILADYWLAPDW